MQSNFGPLIAYTSQSSQGVVAHGQALAVFGMGKGTRHPHPKNEPDARNKKSACEAPPEICGGGSTVAPGAAEVAAVLVVVGAAAAAAIQSKVRANPKP